MTDPTCTDDDLTTALAYAREVQRPDVARSVPDGSKLLARALLRQTAELAAITAALDGQPVPPDAGERAQRVARLASLDAALNRALDAAGPHTDYRRAFCDLVAVAGAAPAPEDAGPTIEGADGFPVHCGTSLPRESRAEDDGLTAEERAAGWRWDAIDGGPSVLWPPRGSRPGYLASVDAHGWFTFARHEAGDAGVSHGPETGPAGQRAACKCLREAGVL